MKHANTAQLTAVNYSLKYLVDIKLFTKYFFTEVMLWDHATQKFLAQHKLSGKTFFPVALYKTVPDYTTFILLQNIRMKSLYHDMIHDMI